MTPLRIPFALVPVVILLCAAPLTAAERTGTTALASVAGGVFFTSSVVADGAVRVSPCAPATREALKPFGTDYTCAPKAPGYRCSANGRLDLVFVFSERSQCEAERKRLIDAEEE